MPFEPHGAGSPAQSAALGHLQPQRQDHPTFPGAGLLRGSELARQGSHARGVPTGQPLTCWRQCPSLGPRWVLSTSKDRLSHGRLPTVATTEGLRNSPSSVNQIPPTVHDLVKKELAS